jgi:hypothetical protein
MDRCIEVRLAELGADIVRHNLIFQEFPADTSER